MLMIHTWRAAFPGLAGISSKVSDLLDKKAHPISLRKGALIFGPGSSAEHLLLLTAGTVRVQQLSEAGRKSVLYRVHSGESCVFTTACLLAFEDYSAEGVAETDVEAIMIPRDAFDELMSVSRAFRAFVFEAYSKRINNLFLVLEDIAFKRMDIHVAKKLLELQDAQSALHLTHQQLEVELGAAREVILRQLLEFERRGWLTLNRDEIELRDTVAIGRLAQSNIARSPPEPVRHACP